MSYGRIWLYGAIILVVAGVVWGVMRSQSLPTPERPTSSDVVASHGGSRNQSSDATADLTSQPTGNNPSVVAPSRQPDPEFQRWLEAEAIEVNRPKVNVAQKKLQMQKVIAELTPAKAQQLLITARNTSASAGERILATYLLVEAGNKTHLEIQALAESPVPTHGESIPHSEAEVRNNQEKAVRMMAIDGLASQAKSSSQALQALEKLISTIQDPYLRAYAKRKWNEAKRS